MKRIPIVALAILVAGSISALASQDSWKEKREIWFTRPATAWKLGLPVGNGRLGAMVAGTYPKEHIQLNEDSIWAKEPMR